MLDMAAGTDYWSCSWNESPWGSQAAKLLPSLPPRSLQGHVAEVERLLGWLVAEPKVVVSELCKQY